LVARAIVESHPVGVGSVDSVHSQDVECQARFGLLFLRAFHEVSHGRRRVPLNELQSELTRRGWHAWK